MTKITAQPLRTMQDIMEFERALPFNERCAARSIYDVFVQTALEHPASTAITFLPTGAEGEDVIDVNYQELLAGVTRAANFFHHAGGRRPGVAYLLPNLIDTHFVLWGAEAAGYAVPVNFMLQPTHIAELLQAAGVAVLVALGPSPHLDVWEKALAVAKLLPNLKLIQVAATPQGQLPPGVLDFRAGCEAQPSDHLVFGTAASDTDVAAYFHTGGTTGAPKLVTHTHRNQILAAFGGAALLDISEEDAVVMGVPMFHVAATIMHSLSLFMVGARQVMLSPSGMRNPTVLKNFWKICERHRITLSGAVPTIMSALVSVPVNGDLSRVRYSISGAAAAPRSLIEQYEQHIGKPVHEGFGMTECGGLVALTPGSGRRKLGSVGLRLPYTEMVVRRLGADGALGEPCAANEVGVLVVTGQHATRGYRHENHPPASNETHTVNTGDLAYLDEDGWLYIAGRAKDLIIRSGHNIDPQLIEEVLQQHPAVAVAAAVGEPDRYAGELPVCYVTLKPGAAMTAEELRAFAEPRLAERAAWPKQYYIIDAIPLTGVGKVFKPALRSDAARRYVARTVAGILGADLAHVSVDAGGKHGLEVKVELPGSRAGQRPAVESALQGHLFRHTVVSRTEEILRDPAAHQLGM
jgi:fatty-acyl-CoA synthase